MSPDRGSDCSRKRPRHSRAIHELATSALKYGVLSQTAGRIEISWRIDSEAGAPQLVFEWRERDGPSVTSLKRKGIGTELLERTLAFEFKGINGSGLHGTITIPMSPRAAADDSRPGNVEHAHENGCLIALGQSGPPSNWVS